VTVPRRSRGRDPRWFASGDVNGFLALALDNLTNLVILSSLLVGVFKFPADLVLFRMVPGTAVGVLVGDVLYTILAIRLMRRTGRPDVTAMPFGVDTPTLFTMVFGVLGPVMMATGDPVLAWKVGMGLTIAIGVVKIALSFAGDWARRAVPRAGLLGSIAGVALLLIAFLPALEVFADPLVGLIALIILLVALMAETKMPARLPGALVAVMAGATVFWVRGWLTGEGTLDSAAASARLHLALPLPTLAWLDGLQHTLPYLAIALPFALVTIVGGIDNTESAAAAGDEYRTRDILVTEAVATVIAGICGGVVQNTPYIGHPAYKAMGARSGYTLAAGVVIGVGAAVGAVSLLVTIVPKAAVAPILVFIGLEITAQAFRATPARHAAAVAVAFLPVIANLLVIELGSLLTALGKSTADLAGEFAASYQTLTTLGNGFILTALAWGSGLAFLIDRQWLLATSVFALASVATLFGLMHSPLPNGAVFWPWTVASPLPFRLAGAYGLMAALVWIAGWFHEGGRPGPFGNQPTSPRSFQT
jgi:adenine/guanine/hypoxanthine permease